MEKYYPQAVHAKAEKLEHLLLRWEAGEDLTRVCGELELKVSPDRVRKLQAKYEAGGRQRAALLDGRFGHHQHANSEIRGYLYERKQAEPELTGPQLAAEVLKRYQVGVSVGHINHMLREVALSRVTGRPRKPSEAKAGAAGPPAQANAGLFFPGGGEASPGGDGGA
jgi:hypothetical protein